MPRELVSGTPGPRPGIAYALGGATSDPFAGIASISIPAGETVTVAIEQIADAPTEMLARGTLAVQGTVNIG